MGGGRRGQRRLPDTDSSIASSLSSVPRPHFPPSLARSSVFCRPSVLTPRVVPLPPLRAITTPRRSNPELSPVAHGSEGLICLGGFLQGFAGEQSAEKGFRVPERRASPSACPPRGPAVGSPDLLFSSTPTMTEMSEKENEPDDAATHTPPGTVSVLQETKVTREAGGLDPCPVRPRPGRPLLDAVATVDLGALGSQYRAGVIVKAPR